MLADGSAREPKAQVPMVEGAESHSKSRGDSRGKSKVGLIHLYQNIMNFVDPM
jgi:hypothetical protein